MKLTAKSIAFGLTLLTGALLLFIGCRFFLVPQDAEIAFGIHLDTNGDFSFHYIKGARDFFSGLILLALLLLREHRALALVLLCSPVVPVTDFLVVLSHPDYQADKLYPHLTAVVLGIGLGVYYLRSTRTKHLQAQVG